MNGSRTGRLFQKCLIELVQNLTQSFRNIGRDNNALTKVLYHTDDGILNLKLCL